MIEIPLTSDPEQIFSIDLFGTIYSIRVIINSRTNQWSIALESADGSNVVGVIMASGTNIIQPHDFPFKNMFIVNLKDNTLDPAITDLGIESKLVIIEEGDL